MKYLVTGGAGFVGSSIVKALLERGDEVVVLDDFSLGVWRNLPRAGYNTLKVIEGSVNDRKTVEEAMKGCDGVFHEAAHSSTTMFELGPRAFIETNFCGWQNVFDEAESINAAIVFASTSSLYNGLMPLHAEWQHVRPQSPYEVCMLAREKYAACAETSGWAALRYFSVYGENEAHKGKYANLVSQFIWANLQQQKAKIYGDGSQYRDFTFVDDVVDANLRAMDAALKAKDNVGPIVAEGEHVFNVGTGVKTTVMEMAQKVAAACDFPFNVDFAENPVQNYVQGIQADTRLAEKVLGFKAKMPLDVGIKRLAKHYKSIPLMERR